MTSPVTSFFSISTDVVLFSIRNERLEVLLVKRQDEEWKLPGGSLAVNEDLDASALRHLQEQAGLRGVYLEQLYTFGHSDKNLSQRLISVAYYALVPLQQLCVCSSLTDEAPCWFTIDNIPLIRADHRGIIAMAHRRLAAKLAYSTIALQFMPKRFTLSALQSVYETILGETLDKRNFRKRLLSMGCIEATGELSREGNHRPARLYRVKKPGKVEFIK
jgi:8-oxo-dGTP diphosphatase